MKKPGIVILAVTLYAIIYNASPLMGFTQGIILFMFALSPFLVIYMAYVVLKHGKPPGHTFEEKFYDDVD